MVLDFMNDCTSCEWLKIKLVYLCLHPDTDSSPPHPQTLTHTLPPPHLHPPTPSPRPTHPPTPPRPHPFTHPPTHPHPLAYTHLSTHPLTHLFFPSCWLLEFWKLRASRVLCLEEVGRDDAASSAAAKVLALCTFFFSAASCCSRSMCFSWASRRRVCWG